MAYAEFNAGSAALRAKRSKRQGRADGGPEAAPPPPGPMAELLAPLSPKERAELLSEAAGHLARDLAADLVHSELAKAGKGLRQIQRESGLEPAVISRVASGYHARGPELGTLVKIALAMGKTLHLSFEDPAPDDD